MNKITDKIAAAIGRLYLKLEPTVAELGEELRDLWSGGRAKRKEKAHRRRAERERRKNLHRVRRDIFGRQLLGMVIFSAVFWGFIWLCSAMPELYAIVENILVNILLFIPGRQYLDDVPPVILTVYCAVMILWPMVTLFRATGYLDSVYTAADGILDPNNEPEPMPAAISDLDMKLRGVRLSILRNEQLAREAEQRKNDLVVYLAHDLKTPLSSVIGYLTLLDEAPELPLEQRAKYTSITLDKAYRLEQLINEFFDITRFSLQTVELERGRIDLSMMLMQIADEFYPVLEEKRLRVQLFVPPQLMITGDADKLMRVFDNLLRNAAGYSYEGTEIILAARGLGDAVEVTCRNTGDQIPPQSLERLFEKFFRADSARHSDLGGSGLGLAIARNIVQLHGGEITAESTPEYTQFRIALPINPKS